MRESKRKANEDNIEKAKSSGNVLSQTLNEDGNLVNIKDANTIEKSLLENDEEVTQENIKKELFEGDNIVTDLNTDRGLSDVLKNLDNDSNDKTSSE